MSIFICMFRFLVVSISICTVCLVSTPVLAQLSWVVDSIPMRDGKKLAADVYVPPSCSSCPAILIQTPYWRVPYRFFGLPLGIGTDQANSPYAFVIVDWRGWWGSIDADTGAPIDRGEDGYDVIEWISQQAWNNGNVGTWGPSALGNVQFETAREAHPAHKVAVPLVASPQEAYVDYFPGGVLRREYVDQLQNLGFVLSSTFTNNPARNLIWQVAENVSYYPEEIGVPCLMIGGWYDHNTRALLEMFNGIRTDSPVNVRDKHRLLMGPWVHGGTSTASVGTSQQGELQYPAAAGWNDTLALRCFEHYLLGAQNGWDLQPTVQYFQMGDDVWNTADVWPPPSDTLTLFLNSGNSLQTFPPGWSPGPGIFDADPADPSPTVGGPTLNDTLVQGPTDQSPIVESRSDVTIFTSDPLPQDIIVHGTPRARLFASTDRTDGDFAVRLTDVYPDGRSMLVADGIRRLRFRNGFTPQDTSQVVPGQLYTLDIDLTPTSITFKQGHRVRLIISGNNYPRFDANLQNGGPLYQAGDTVVANMMVHLNPGVDSRLYLPIPDADVGIGVNTSSEHLQIRVGLHEACLVGHNGPWPLLWTVYSIDGRIVEGSQTSENCIPLQPDQEKRLQIIRCELPGGRSITAPYIPVR